MLHEEHVKHGPLLGGDVDETSVAWRREKRRRKDLPQSSSSDAPTATAQGHEAPISYAKDHQGSISDMAIDQAQDNELFGPQVILSEEDQASCVEKLLPDIPPLPQSSSSGAPTATAQGYEAPISYAKDHQGLISDMAIDQAQDNELFGPEVFLSEEYQASCLKKLLPDIPPPMSMTKMSWMDNCKLLERHGRFRIAYHKAVKPESGRELTEKDAYSEDEIRELDYFKHLEYEDCFEWFFHTDDIWNPDLDDYQRIVLRNFIPGCIQPLYPDVDDYHELYHTYEMDAVYVKYYGEISKKIKWIKEFLHLDKKSPEWTDIKTRGWRQALRIATQVPSMTLSSAALAYNEYISELRKDESLKDLDLVFFEIWRRVDKDNRSYMDALKEVYEMDNFHTHKRIMEAELNKGAVFVTMRQKINYISWKLGITANTEDDKARDLFRKGLDMIKTKNMANYAEKKMEIAERLNLHKRIEVPGTF